MNNQTLHGNKGRFTYLPNITQNSSTPGMNAGTEVGRPFHPFTIDAILSSNVVDISIVLPMLYTRMYVLVNSMFSG